MTYYLRLAVRKWKNAFEFERPVGITSNLIIKAASIGFLEVYKSLAALRKAYPDSEYLIIKTKDTPSP